MLQAKLKRRGESPPITTLVSELHIKELQGLLRNLDAEVDSRGLTGLCEAAHSLLEVSWPNCNPNPNHDPPLNPRQNYVGVVSHKSTTNWQNL